MNLKKLRYKGQLFAKKYLHYWLRNNYNLRAKGIYPSLNNYIEAYEKKNVIYQEVFPSYKSKLDLSKSMLEASSKHVSYDLEVIEPAKYLVSVEQGRIFTDLMWIIAIFDSKDKLIGDISLDLFLKKGQSIVGSRILHRKFFSKEKYFEGTVFPTVGGGGTYVNYAHWLIDSLSRICLLKKSGRFEEVDWFYVPSIKYDYQLDSLKAMGVPESKIIDSTQFPHIRADRLLVSSYTRGNYYHLPNWVINFYSTEFKAKGIPRYPSKKYFISRKDSSLRNISNEDEISQFLGRYGIETIVLSELSLQEKIDLFAYADLIISLWGAGLVNFLFSKEGTKVVEIFGDQHIDFTLYSEIARKRKLEYHYLIGKNIENVRNWRTGQHSDVYIDVDSMKFLLEEELNLSI